MSKKVRIVDSLKEKERSTGIGVIKFDSKGVSIEEFDRSDVLKLIEASGQLSIQGEKKIIKTKIEVPIVEETKGKDKTFSKEEVDSTVKKNAERLVKLICDTLGLDSILVEKKMSGGVLETVPQMLVPVTEIVEVIKKNVTNVELRSEVEIKEASNKEELATAKEKLDQMNIEDLRGTLLKSGIDKKLWESLKGAEGKSTMAELILDKIKKEQ